MLFGIAVANIIAPLFCIRAGVYLSFQKIIDRTTYRTIKISRSRFERSCQRNDVGNHHNCYCNSHYGISSGTGIER